MTQFILSKDAISMIASLRANKDKYKAGICDDFSTLSFLSSNLDSDNVREILHVMNTLQEYVHLIDALTGAPSNDIPG